MLNWNKNPPLIDGDAILAQVDVTVKNSKGEIRENRTDTYLCRVDDCGDMVDLEHGTDYGWDYTCVDRWVHLSDIVAMLNEE